MTKTKLRVKTNTKVGVAVAVLIGLGIIAYVAGIFFLPKWKPTRDYYSPYYSPSYSPHYGYGYFSTGGKPVYIDREEVSRVVITSKEKFVSPGETIRLKAELFNPNGQLVKEPFPYWSASAGSFVKTEVPGKQMVDFDRFTALYKAPEIPGQYIITVKAFTLKAGRIIEKEGKLPIVVR